MKKLSVVVPVYFNEGSLANLYSKLKQVEEKLNKNDIQLELIFVDDGSKDNSLNELLKIKNQKHDIKIIKLTRNFGAVQAVKISLNYVTGDCFLVLAADLQDPPELICEMVDHWLNGSKYVICERIRRDDPLISKLFANFYYKLLRLFVIKDYPSGGFDLALMDKSILPHLLKSAKNINIALFAYWLGFKPTVITYQRQPRIHGKSRWTFTKKINYFIDSILGFSNIPIRILSITGILISGLSFGYGLFIAMSAALGHIHVSGFATLAILISFFSGLIIIMLGVIGEYLSRIFNEIANKPEAVIDEIY